MINFFRRSARDCFEESTEEFNQKVSDENRGALGAVIVIIVIMGFWLIYTWL